MGKCISNWLRAQVQATRAVEKHIVMLYKGRVFFSVCPWYATRVPFPLLLTAKLWFAVCNSLNNNPEKAPKSCFLRSLILYVQFILFKQTWCSNRFACRPTLFNVIRSFSGWYNHSKCSSFFVLYMRTVLGVNVQWKTGDLAYHSIAPLQSECSSFSAPLSMGRGRALCGTYSWQKALKGITTGCLSSFHWFETIHLASVAFKGEGWPHPTYGQVSTASLPWSTWIRGTMVQMTVNKVYRQSE